VPRSGHGATTPSSRCCRNPVEDAHERDESTEFDALAAVARWMPQQPGVALVRTTGEEPTVRQIYSGSRPQDCPFVDKMLEVATFRPRRANCEPSEQ